MFKYYKCFIIIVLCCFHFYYSIILASTKCLFHSASPLSCYGGHCYLNLSVILILLLFEFVILISLFFVQSSTNSKRLFQSQACEHQKPFVFWSSCVLLFVYMKLPFPFIGDWFKGDYQYSFVLVYPVGIFYLLF